MTPAPATGTPARRGRPRDDAAEQAILEAVVELLEEQGFNRLTIGGVAARAGVGKPTVYRRWASKSELVVDAVVRLAKPITARRTGDPHADLRALTQAAITEVSTPPLGSAVVMLLAETHTDAELAKLVHDRLARPRRGVLRDVIDLGVETGQLRADTDPEQMLDLLLGPSFYRWLITGRAPTRPAIARMVDIVWAAYAS